MSDIIDNGNEIIGYSHDVLDHIRKSYIHCLNHFDAENYNYLMAMHGNDLDIMYDLSQMGTQLVIVKYYGNGYDICELIEKTKGEENEQK